MFWLKQNSICSDRILTFGIRSRFELRRDGDQSGLPEAIVAGAMEDVAVARASDARSRGRERIKRYFKKGTR